MTLRDQIVQEALAWCDTPYQDHCALRGIATDCVGVLIGVAKAVEVLPAAWGPGYYSPEFHLHQQEERLLQALADLGCTPIPFDARQAGDILTLHYGHVSSHTAVLVSVQPDTIVHAARDAGCVVHQGLRGRLLARVRGCYAFPGVV